VSENALSLPIIIKIYYYILYILFLSDPIRHASSEGVCQSLQAISSEQSATKSPSVSFTEPMNIPG
jgi:hypothetical protein